MRKHELKLPNMGESVAEATITSWLKNIGDNIEIGDSLVEIATDKVDSDVSSEVSGVLEKCLFKKDEIVRVGETLAIIDVIDNIDKPKLFESLNNKNSGIINDIEEKSKIAKRHQIIKINSNKGTRFYSPLVQSIARKEGFTKEQIDLIKGTGLKNRVTKRDILEFAKNFKRTKQEDSKKEISLVQNSSALNVNDQTAGQEILEMTRVGEIISEHMTKSIQTSAHVQSFIEVDVTNIFNWREKVKKNFEEQLGLKLTFTPIFMNVIAQGLLKFPMLNASVELNKIIKKRNINLGMATALQDGNLVVPVIKNADQLNLIGMTRAVNDLAIRARQGLLKPLDISGGTYTVSNIGGFGSIMGTPIINQPQVGILAIGVIRKVPAVIETLEGDFIGIRQRMFLSHSYDHRVINGALGGMFIKHLKELLEGWDSNKII